MTIICCVRFSHCSYFYATVCFATVRGETTRTSVNVKVCWSRAAVSNLMNCPRILEEGIPGFSQMSLTLCVVPIDRPFHHRFERNSRPDSASRYCRRGRILVLKQQNGWNTCAVEGENASKKLASGRQREISFTLRFEPIGKVGIGATSDYEARRGT